jgi:hypothetical protein
MFSFVKGKMSSFLAGSKKNLITHYPQPILGVSQFRSFTGRKKMKNALTEQNRSGILHT